MGPDATSHPGRGRLVGARSLAVLGLLVWNLLLMGVVDLSTAIVELPGFYDTYVLETGWGLLYSVLLGVPTARLVVRPTSDAAARQLLVPAAALVLVALVTPEPGHLVPAALAVGLVAGVRALAGARALPTVTRRAPSAASAVPAFLVAVAAVPAVVFAVDMVRGARETRYPVSVTQGLDHWPAQAALALAVVAVVALVVFGEGRASGVLPGAASAAWWGLVSTRYPEHGGSLGTVGGWAAVAWSLALLTALLLPVLRSRGGPSDHELERT